MITTKSTLSGVPRSILAHGELFSHRRRLSLVRKTEIVKTAVWLPVHMGNVGHYTLDGSVLVAMLLSLTMGFCMIKVKNFSKSYGDFEAVKDLSFGVGPGDILGLVGANGAGKSTTLRVLSGIIGPTSGSLAIAGHDIINAPIQAKQRLGYIPDDPRLFDTLTVWEHLAFSAAAYDVEHFEDKADALLRSFDLTNQRDTLAHDLSRGMRQKVAIACAFLHEPEVLLFDEPLTGLDPQGIRTIQQSMRERAQEGAAIIISSHLLSLVENLCSHVLVLHLGECRHFGTLSEALLDVDRQHGDSALEAAFFAITRDAQTGEG